MTEEEAKAALEAARSAEMAARLAHNAARQHVIDAKAQLAAVKSATCPDHEWEGLTVTRTIIKYRGSGYYRVPQKVTERGVVFTYRVGVDLGRWVYAPEIGAPFVRLLTKGGLQGKICTHLSPEWTLEAA